jgi:hypothetical protein
LTLPYNLKVDVKVKLRHPGLLKNGVIDEFRGAMLVFVGQHELVVLEIVSLAVHLIRRPAVEHVGLDKRIRLVLAADDLVEVRI